VAKESTSPKKRIVKKAESVREQMENKAGKPVPQKHGALRLAGHYIAVPFKPIGKLLAKVGRLKPFRLLGHILLPTYLRNSWKELRQVTWPGRKESWQLTLAVILFAVIFGLLIAVVDFGLDKAFKQVLLK